MDAQNAYLDPELDKKIYMELSEGVEHLSDQVCELLKSLYELKQLANLWNKKITKTLKSIEFKLTLADTSVFTYSHSIIIALYIDDMLILAKSLKELEEVKNQIKKTHLMKDLAAVSKILEIHVTHQNDSSIKIDQGHYIKQVLAEFWDGELQTSPSSAKFQSQPWGPGIRDFEY